MQNQYEVTVETFSVCCMREARLASRLAVGVDDKFSADAHALGAPLNRQMHA